MKSICSKYTIEEVNQEKWSYYWSKVSHHNLVQSWEYGEAKNTADTWIPIRFLVRDNKDNPVAILQVLTKTWPLIGGIARLNRGPLLIKNNEVTIELEYKIKIDISMNQSIKKGPLTSPMPMVPKVHRTHTSNKQDLIFWPYRQFY